MARGEIKVKMKIDLKRYNQVWEDLMAKLVKIGAYPDSQKEGDEIRRSLNKNFGKGLIFSGKLPKEEPMKEPTQTTLEKADIVQFDGTNWNMIEEPILSEEHEWLHDCNDEDLMYWAEENHDFLERISFARTIMLERMAVQRQKDQEEKHVRLYGPKNHYSK